MKDYVPESKYQPSGEGGARSPPARLKMAARGPQNGRRGLEKCLPLGFGRFKQLSLNKFFDPSTPSMKKGLDGGNGKKTGEKTGNKKKRQVIKWPLRHCQQSTARMTTAGTLHVRANIVKIQAKS